MVPTFVLTLDFFIVEPEPEDDDVIRHITRLREKLGWQTVLSQHDMKCSKAKIQNITLKVLLYFIQF